MFNVGTTRVLLHFLPPRLVVDSCGVTREATRQRSLIFARNDPYAKNDLRLSGIAIWLLKVITPLMLSFILVLIFSNMAHLSGVNSLELSSPAIWPDFLLKCLTPFYAEDSDPLIFCQTSL